MRCYAFKKEINRYQMYGFVHVWLDAPAWYYHVDCMPFPYEFEKCPRGFTKRDQE